MKKSRKNKKREQIQNTVSAREELRHVREGINDAYCVFNSTSDPDALDAIILEISALQSKYSLLLKKYKDISEVS